MKMKNERRVEDEKENWEGERSPEIVEVEVAGGLSQKNFNTPEV